MQNKYVQSAYIITTSKYFLFRSFRVAFTNHQFSGCWNNALQPLWIAGKLLSSDYEHEIILNLLDKIESTTGWQMKFRKKDLKKYWNGLMVE